MKTALSSSNQLDSPIFIVGCGHSGTSLLLSILGSHPQVHPIPQETNIGFLPQAADIMETFDQTAQQENLSRWIEKSPRHIHRIERLLKLRPKAKILLMLRDGRDVACSIQDRFESIDIGITRWYKDNLAAEPFWNHENVLPVRYESLVTSFQQTLEEILQFLELPNDNAVNEYHREKKFYYADTIQRPPDGKGDNHDSYRNWQINQPVYDARGKWLRMTDSEKHMFKTVAGEMLIRHGYAQNNDW